MHIQLISVSLRYVPGGGVRLNCYRRQFCSSNSYS